MNISLHFDINTIRRIPERLLALVSPRIAIGGLEIADNFLRYFAVQGGTPKTAAARLAPGIVSGGRVKDAAAFRGVLRQLRGAIAPAEKPVHVVVSLSASGAYSQVFGVPAVSRERMPETVQLNLQMISPIGIERVYADAEPVGVGAGGEAEYLGAFLERSIVDDIAGELKDSGFTLVALEFAGLSLARLIRELGAGYGGREARLVLELSATGLELLILRNGNLYFDHFTAWHDALPETSRAIDEQLFAVVLVREVQRVLNFYSGKWPGKITEAILLTRGIAPRVSAILKTRFDLTVSEFSATRFADVLPSFAVAAGAYLRGQVPRAEDAFISLAPVGTEEAFARARLRHFVAFWRVATLTVAGFVFLAMLTSSSVLARVAVSLGTSARLTPRAEELAEVERLGSEAKQFNALLDFALRARQNAKPRAALFMELQRIAGTGVALERVSLASKEGNVRISGRAASELSAINFKNALIKQPGFTDVLLPLANIVTDSDGKVTFQLTLKARLETP